MIKTQGRAKVQQYLFFFSIFLLISFGVLFPRLSLPFGMAYIIYAMVRPIRNFLDKQEDNAKILFTVLLVSVGVFILVPLVYSVLELDSDIQAIKYELPRIQYVIESKYSIFRTWAYSSYGIEMKPTLVSQLAQKIQSKSEIFIMKIPGLLSTLLEWAILLPLFLYFFFSESHRTKEKLLSYIPNNYFEKTYVLFHQFNSKFSGYILAKFIEATILGLVVGLGLYFVGTPYWPLLALFAGITNILPYIGPILGFIPALLVIFLTPNTDHQLFATCMVYLVANAVDMLLVFPLLVSRIVNLHPILVIVSVIVGSQLGGIVGMIVCIPVTAFVKLLVIEIYKDLYYHQ